MAVKDTAQLTLDNTNDIASASAPDSIDPTLDAARRKDLIDSLWNKDDGITIGTPYDAALVIPPLFNATIHDGDDLRDIVQALMDQIAADNILITGGVQGRAGEFLANITSETKQTFVLLQSGTAAYSSLAKIKFPNDKDNGCFDNGNNWLVDFFKTPTGGQASVRTSGNGIILNVLSNTITPNSGGSGYNFKCCITKNTGTILATSNEVQIRDGSGTGNLYFTDWDTGTIALAANDIISIELYIQVISMTVVGTISQCKVQLTNGFANHQII